MEAPLGPSRESINARATTYEPNHASGRGSGLPTLGHRIEARAGVALPMPKFTLARDQSVPENGRAVFTRHFEQEIEQASAELVSVATDQRAPPPRGSPTHIDEVAVFKAQVVAPTFLGAVGELGPGGPPGPEGPASPFSPRSPLAPGSPFSPCSPFSPLGPVSPLSPLGPEGLAHFSPVFVRWSLWLRLMALRPRLPFLAQPQSRSRSQSQLEGQATILTGLLVRDAAL